MLRRGAGVDSDGLQMIKIDFNKMVLMPPRLLPGCYQVARVRSSMLDGHK